MFFRFFGTLIRFRFLSTAQHSNPVPKKGQISNSKRRQNQTLVDISKAPTVGDQTSSTTSISSKTPKQEIPSKFIYTSTCFSFYTFKAPHPVSPSQQPFSFSFSFSFALNCIDFG
ncbi:hypothetical protein V6N13_042983 [Hibiscus sabdariffa]|uniref:Uncharacterized protein n=1 Tax=Hibiscus sabdariffa TaxID=183260 RepID=A0ABR2G2Y7_9ROSI